jgi:hypothetical protein
VSLKNKKGVMFFTVDALMAGVIFTFTVVLLLSFMLKVPVSVDAKYYLDEYTDYVSNTKMSQFKSTSKIYYDAQEQNPDMLIYQKILLMKYNGYSDATITSFVENFSSFVLPKHIGVEYKLDDVIIYSRNGTGAGEISINKSDIYLSTSILTFVVDENNVLYGPNVTRLAVWV